MNAFQMHHIEMLHLLWLLPLLAGVSVYAHHKRKKDLRLFITADILLKSPASVNYQRRFLKALLLIIAIAFLIIGLSRPAWNQKEITIKQKGRDVVFLVDVSRSMLAEDLKPNRLERAKLAILDCLSVLQGDRIALVAFSGKSKIICPLTLDYGFFRLMLENVGINAVDKGGTLIGDALRTVLSDVFDDQVKQYKDVVLITDGEDHDSFPVEAAKTAAEKGVRLLIVGLGDETEGRRIPVTDQQGKQTFLKYQGQEVWTKLDGDTLRQMALATNGGQYLPVATGTIDLGKVYRELIASAQKQELDEKIVQRFEEKFQIFIGICFMLLLIEACLGEKKAVTSDQ